MLIITPGVVTLVAEMVLLYDHLILLAQLLTGFWAARSETFFASSSSPARKEYFARG